MPAQFACLAFREQRSPPGNATLRAPLLLLVLLLLLAFSTRSPLRIILDLARLEAPACWKWVHCDRGWPGEGAGCEGQLVANAVPAEADCAAAVACKVVGANPAGWQVFMSVVAKSRAPTSSEGCARSLTARALHCQGG